jgi:hypothetical protein
MLDGNAHMSDLTDVSASLYNRPCRLRKLTCRYLLESCPLLLVLRRCTKPAATPSRRPNDPSAAGCAGGSPLASLQSWALDRRELAFRAVCRFARVLRVTVEMLTATVPVAEAGKAPRPAGPTGRRVISPRVKPSRPAQQRRETKRGARDSSK